MFLSHFIRFVGKISPSISDNYLMVFGGIGDLFVFLFEYFLNPLLAMYMINFDSNLLQEHEDFSTSYKIEHHIFKNIALWL